jgi:hypothetical protein
MIDVKKMSTKTIKNSEKENMISIPCVYCGNIIDLLPNLDYKCEKMWKTIGCPKCSQKTQVSRNVEGEYSIEKMVLCPFKRRDVMYINCDHCAEEHCNARLDFEANKFVNQKQD